MHSLFSRTLAYAEKMNRYKNKATVDTIKQYVLPRFQKRDCVQDCVPRSLDRGV